VIVALDVDYGARLTRVAFVGFDDWGDERAAREGTATYPPAPAPYASGQFFRRELGYLLTTLRDAVDVAPSLIVVDGYTWLGVGKPGLGAHLYEHLERKIPVVGVAKRSFRDNTLAIPVLRGTSKQPLFVTAAGIDAAAMAAEVSRMAGAHRIPVLLKRVDRLARGDA
jgi:deoxyribonuclease V